MYQQYFIYTIIPYLYELYQVHKDTSNIMDVMYIDYYSMAMYFGIKCKYIEFVYRQIRSTQYLVKQYAIGENRWFVLIGFNIYFKHFHFLTNMILLPNLRHQQA